jgi:hypothetical protein
LYAKVLAGELTPHAAMVEAGFRKKTYRIDREDAPGVPVRVENVFFKILRIARPAIPLRP